MKPATARNYAHEVVTDVMHNTLPNLSVAQRARDQVEQLKEDNAKLVAALQTLKDSAALTLRVCPESYESGFLHDHVIAARALLRELGEL